MAVPRARMYQHGWISGARRGTPAAQPVRPCARGAGRAAFPQTVRDSAATGRPRRCSRSIQGVLAARARTQASRTDGDGSPRRAAHVLREFGAPRTLGMRAAQPGAHDARRGRQPGAPGRSPAVCLLLVRSRLGRARDRGPAVARSLRAADPDDAADPGERLRRRPRAGPRGHRDRRARHRRPARRRAGARRRRGPADRGGDRRRDRIVGDRGPAPRAAPRRAEPARQPAGADPARARILRQPIADVAEPARRHHGGRGQPRVPRRVRGVARPDHRAHAGARRHRDAQPQPPGVVRRARPPRGDHGARDPGSGPRPAPSRR